MRWVDKGPMPSGLAGYQSRCTQDWTDYYNRRTGDEPPAYWGRFREELAGRFVNKCGYCERQCGVSGGNDPRSATVDHFKPRYLYPELTYDWANWVFSCFQCNVVNKQDKWPLGGYVDPCAADIKERPERFFGYDAKTGEVVPKPGLTKSEYDKAYRTITDLGLNSINVRWDRAKQIDRTQSVLMEWPLAEWDDLIEQLCDPSLEFSGITRAFLQHWLVPKECGEP